MERRGTRIGLWIWTVGVVLFLHIPIVIIILYAFNASNVQGWPITDWTTKWFGPAIHNDEMQQALWLSLKAARSRPRSRSCSGRWRRSRSTAPRSSAGRWSRSCSSCRSRSPGSSPAWR